MFLRLGEGTVWAGLDSPVINGVGVVYSGACNFVCLFVGLSVTVIFSPGEEEEKSVSVR